MHTCAVLIWLRHSGFSSVNQKNTIFVYTTWLHLHYCQHRMDLRRYLFFLVIRHSVLERPVDGLNRPINPLNAEFVSSVQQS